MVLRRLAYERVDTAFELGIGNSTTVAIPAVEQGDATAADELRSGAIDVRAHAAQRVDDLKRATSTRGVCDYLHAEHRRGVLESSAPRQQAASPATLVFEVHFPSGLSLSMVGLATP